MYILRFSVPWRSKGLCGARGQTSGEPPSSVLVISYPELLGRPTLVGERGGLEFYPQTFFFISSSRAMDGHQMYSGGSGVGKASKIGIEISPNPPLIFIGVKKCEIWRRFRRHSNLSRPRSKM